MGSWMESVNFSTASKEVPLPDEIGVENPIRDPPEAFMLS
ncbi:hypothetical protein MFFC18_49910 [Mariniblastus fucicola]|uniref:Uncharacterized protein n=1 Tax=Mariniblastus fucicola TaxID=980251 RepID=A0A5B9PF85_9BACT|nr:hypothetical protein MFFC18_49910 [Mariniblastus fucicola]